MESLKKLTLNNKQKKTYIIAIFYPHANPAVSLQGGEKSLLTAYD